jgi:Family of unknown function (DUF5681)
MANPHPTPRPENLKPFPKGTSGNPGGRTRAKVDLLAVLNEVLADKAKARELVEALVDAGIGTKANVRAIQEVLNRVHGPVAPIGTTEGTLVEVAKIIKERLQKPQDNTPA